MNDTIYVPNFVLVADDDPGIRKVMRAALQQGGFQVIDVADGKAAVEGFKKYAPGLVLLDVEMPGMNGFEACAEIRALPEGERVPIVMVTGRDDIAAIDEAYDAGATDFIAKPINWPLLGHRVRYILRATTHHQKMQISEAKNDVLLRTVPDSMLILTKDGSIVDYMPGSSSHPLPAPADGCQTVAEYLPPKIAKRWLHLLATATRETDPGHCEFSLPTAAGQLAHYQARFVPYIDDKTLVMVTEFTERKLAEERIYRLAFFDTLTGLPNRTYFLQHLARMFEMARRKSSRVAILYIDLDHFKRINDNLGHSYGDGVLKAIGKRLASCVRKHPASSAAGSPNFGIARLGGDEFACALDDVEDDSVLNSVAERIRSRLSEPVTYRGHEFVVTPSIGIALYPQDGEDVGDLLKHADVAMYQAKGAGRDSVRFYSNTMSLRSMRRLELEGKLRRAIEIGALELHYQPKCDLQTGRIVGVEALTRWKDEQGQYIPPAHFIPVAEESGLIIALGEWVLRKACAQVRDWQRTLGADIEIAVNISSQQFYQSDLKNTVMKAIFEASIRPNLLQLELTESLLMRDVKNTIDTLRYLKDSGISLAIDDFGTGYSSLSYLKRFPLDFLKIDRSFVADLEDSDDSAAICAAIIAMAHRLGLAVVAEGIETKAQLEFLRSQGCEQGQGFLLGKPMPAKSFEQAILSKPSLTAKRARH